uniref:Uncharacterized protein n=1 Tax=Arundo donax TaxID=35708 RepID=A0A0A9F356_ARUDO
MQMTCSQGGWRRALSSEPHYRQVCCLLAASR